MSNKTHIINYKDETKVHPALVQYFGYCLNKSSLWLRSLLNAELKKHKILAQHLAIIKIIDSVGPISQIRLGDELGIDKASMVKIIDELEGKKIVQRISHPTDRRIKNIQITGHGKKIFQQCHRAKNSAEKIFFKSLTASEVKFFKEIIVKLLPDHL